ncbi:hypothetical protein ACJX0J_029789, partial [Zea mays]
CTNLLALSGVTVFPSLDISYLIWGARYGTTNITMICKICVENIINIVKQLHYCAGLHLAFITYLLAHNVSLDTGTVLMKNNGAGQLLYYNKISQKKPIVWHYQLIGENDSF